MPFTAYDLFSRRGIDEATFNVAGACGVCMMAVTKDNVLVLQMRSAKNRSYGRVPGATVAGLLDAEVGNDNQQLPVNNQTLGQKM